MSTSTLSEPVRATAVRIAPLSLGSQTLDWSRTYLMGVVNVTPDSFSDGGRFLDSTAAVRQGLELAEAGADILDVGGESTRPGADPVSAAEELARVIPVLEGVRDGCGIPLSIDTYKAEVAAAACRAGATVVNDVSGLTLDPELGAAVAEAGAALVVGHIRGTPLTMQSDVSYEDVLAEVVDGLRESVELAVAAGVSPERILVDPGIGFGKSVAGNLTLIRGAGALRERLGHAVLLGPSRKSFIGKLTGAGVEERLPGTLAALVVGRLSGADVMRVHDVSEARQAAIVTDALLRDGGGGRRRPR
jgi:dihydropteroate synthase